MIHRFLLLIACSAAVFAAQAQSCSSDGVAQPQALLERFTNADCEACWRDPATPKARANEFALDWIVPGSQGDDAPLSMAASVDALDRLESLNRQVPPKGHSLRSPAARNVTRLRVAQGDPVNDYIGTSIELRARGAARAWLLLVEEVPAGAEGSPVPRNVVRNAFRADAPRGRLDELRPMQIHEGTKFERLRVVGLVEDAHGRLRAIARSRCAPEGVQR